MQFFLSFLLLVDSDYSDAVPTATPHPNRPTGLQLQIAKVVLTNSRVEPGAGHHELTTHLKKASELRSHLAPTASKTSPTFPSSREDLDSLPDCWSDYLKVTSPGFLRINAIPSPPPTDDADSFSHVPSNGLNVLRTNSLKQVADEDVWSISLSQVWADFTGIKRFSSIYVFDT